MPKKLPTKPRLPQLTAPGTRSRKSKKNGSDGEENQSFECELSRQINGGDSSLGLTRSQRAVLEITAGEPTSSRGVRRLVNLATEAIHQLEQLWKDGNRHLRAVAQGRIDWPVLTAHHHAILQKNKQLIKDIELGRDARNRVLLEQLPARATPAREQTRRLLLLVAHIQSSAVWGECIHEDITRCDASFLKLLRQRLSQDYTPTTFRKIVLTWPLVLQIKQLPDICSEEVTIGRWQKAAFELLSLSCQDNPASIPRLCRLGLHRRYHPYRANLPRALKRGLVSPEQQRINVNREIREILKEEIRKIADHIEKMALRQSE